MPVPPPRCLLRRERDPAALLAAHPPHPYKRLAFELACPLDLEWGESDGT